VGRVGLPLYLFLLLAAPGWMSPRVSMPRIGVRDLSSITGGLRWALTASPLLLQLARFAPLGFLAVFALPRRRRWAKRYLFVIAPAVVITTLLAAVVLSFESGRGDIPGVFALTSAFLICALGAWIGENWLRGWLARFLIIPKLILVALLVPAAAGLFFYLSLQSTPLGLDPPTLTSGTRRRLYRTLAGQNPKKIPPGATATLQLTGGDINDLLAWGASTMDRRPLAHVDLSRDRPTVMISTQSPVSVGQAKYLNIIADGGMQITDGELYLSIHRLLVGPVEVPGFLLDPFSVLVASEANHSERLRPFLAPVRDMRLSSSGLSATYGPAVLPPGLIASLFAGADSIKELQDAVSIHAGRLVKSEARLLPADRRFGGTLETAFRFARERSKEHDPTVENQAAILALGILLGHRNVDQLIGPLMDDAQWRAARAFRETTLRRRSDWTKHFWLSASIVVLSTQGIADAAGMLKEELDADGGSGFSFGDLLADRSGTTFALAATRDANAARAIQDRLARGFRADDFIPDGTDLPEDMTDAQLRARFGGVGGAAFRRLTDEIERRLAACGAYRGRVVPASQP
jgi:hypothetical protein